MPCDLRDVGHDGTEGSRKNDILTEFHLNSTNPIVLHSGLKSF